MNNAAAGGRLDMVQWLHNWRKEGCIAQAMNKAAANGHLAVVRSLHSWRKEGCTIAPMDNAARIVLFEMLEWMPNNRQEGCSTEAVDQAAKNGHVDIVKWIMDNRSEGGSTNAIDFAAAEGHLEIDNVYPRSLTRYGGWVRLPYDVLKRSVIVAWQHDVLINWALTKQFTGFMKAETMARSAELIPERHKSQAARCCG